jgi:hypothetical protein
MTDTQPEPGSPAAVAQGCTCPPQTGPTMMCDENCSIHSTSDWVEPCPHRIMRRAECPACGPD